MSPQSVCPGGCKFTLVAFVSCRITKQVFSAMINIHHFLLLDPFSCAAFTELTEKGNLNNNAVLDGYITVVLQMDWMDPQVG